VSKASIKKGDSIIVSGSIIPPREGVTVTLTYEAPDGTTLKRTVTTSEDGAYSHTYAPENVGSWSVKGSWAGDEGYAGAESSSASFEVQEEERKVFPCIIATTTYGSELAAEVQFLRGFRDQKVLSTFAGTQFMNVFNAWYYSFSPNVAGFIAATPTVRDCVKALLYPLIGILRLSSATYAAFGFNEEIAVVMAGLVASSMIGIVYFSPLTVPPLMAVKLRRKSLLKLGYLKPLLAIWFASLGLIFLGTIAAMPIVMMAATASLVLSTITLSAVAIGLTVVRRLL